VEAIEGNALAAGKAFATGLAFRLLDGVANAIADQGMEGGIGIALLITQRIRTGVSGCADMLMFAARAFASGPGGSTPGLWACPQRGLG
jgi:hypothetical protein